MQAGSAFVPMALLGVVAPLVGGRLIARLGAPRAILLGSACSAAALGALAVLLGALGAGLPVWAMLPALALLGVGNMLVLPAMIGATLAGVAPSAAGAASGMLNTGQQFAGAAGLAVVGTVFFAVLGAPGPAGYAAAPVGS